MAARVMALVHVGMDSEEVADAVGLPEQFVLGWGNGWVKLSDLPEDIEAGHDEPADEDEEVEDQEDE